MTVPFTTMANAIRFLSIDAVEKANSGHPGLPMGMAAVVTVLFRDFMHIDPAAPDWADRDRFILSAGHGSMLLYSLAHLLGFPAATMDELQRFRQLGSRTPGHPEHDLSMMAETTTGPLGQGFANAVGMALAERILKHDHRTYVLASDGDMMEGINHEAAALAAHWQLHKLCVLYDDNGISIDGPTHLSMSEDVAARYAAYGWATRRIDGHNESDIHAALVWAQQQTKPTLLLCKTTIGFGAPTKAGSHHAHGSPLGAAEIAGARTALGWPHAPFTIPTDIKQAWEACAMRGKAKRAAAPASKQPAHDYQRAIAAIKTTFLLEKPTQATRTSSGQVLAALLPALPQLIGGSADLTPSNNTQVKDTGVIAAPDYTGRYLHFGVREFAMGAIMNGMALHGPANGAIIPYGGTFLVFSDYMRNAIRMAAIMRTRTIFVFTHDSIGLGEDGPTHQPVEHLAALRAIPHLRVLRPADAVETAEAWEFALQYNGPSALCLTRQNVPSLRHATNHGVENFNGAMRGGYVLREEAGAQLTLFASGSEVSLAVAVAEKLFHAGHAANVVSMPCVELFFQQDATYIHRVLAPHTMPVAIEAGVRQGWDRIIGGDGLFFGLDDFGASAPYQDIYKQRGLTADAITAAILRAF
jgi:transketolase